jgi:hypothetical protein
LRFADFDAMVHRMTAEVPPEYLEGVAEVQVSRAALPDPVREEIWTMGECIPLPGADPDPESVQSRVVLYHGSFLELARLDPEFDWREEAWETLTHELRHHLEWRARTGALEAFDRAADANFARHDGEPFDPLFFHDGEAVAPGVWRVDHDYFLEQVVRDLPRPVAFAWHGRAWQFDPPADATLPAHFLVEGVDDPPPGDLVVVVRRRPRLRDLIGAPGLCQVPVTARRGGAPPG